MVSQATVNRGLNRILKGEGPESGTITLSQRRVFILPTKSGLLFAMLLFVMLLAAIHYNNSLAHGLVFLLVSLAVISILHTYRNLHGISFKAGDPKPVFVGDEVSFPVYIENRTRRPHFSINVAWPKSIPKSVDLPAHSGAWVALPLTAIKRGNHPMGRFTVYTRFPLGMFHGWSHLQFDVSYLVYPRPVAESGLPQELLDYVGEVGDRGRGTDDFAGIRDYHPGDSMHHVDWKAFARGRGLLTRQFGGDRANELMLAWSLLEGMEIEDRLSQLCRWVLEAEKLGARYGLSLPSITIAPGIGEAHRHRCLAELALFGEKR